MGSKLKGITIELEQLTESEADAFGIMRYTSTWANVENVLVGQPTDSEIVDAMQMYGKKAVYVLGIPKGDAHAWEPGTRVRFFGEVFHIFGHSVMGIEAMVPLDWNKKVMVTNVGSEDRAERAGSSGTSS